MRIIGHQIIEFPLRLPSSREAISTSPAPRITSCPSSIMGSSRTRACMVLGGSWVEGWEKSELDCESVHVTTDTLPD